MPFLELLTGPGLGSLLGMRHALEPDHLAAVSTLLTSERSHLKAAWLGACWGLGHTLTLVIAGSVLILLRTEMPDGAAQAFELVVAAMLVGLGLRAVYRAAREDRGGPAYVHRHGQIVHSHGGRAAHVHVGRWTLARRPLLIGAVHGLAGSGALTALVLATLPSTAARVVYTVLFGLGSTIGMAALSGALGWPLGRLARRPGLARSVSMAVGCVTTMLGLWWGFQTF